MPQTVYTFPTEIARAGQPGSGRAAQLARVDSVLNPALRAEWTVTVGGTAGDGVYSFTVDDSGALVSFDRQDSEDDDAIADGLVLGVPESLQNLIEVFKSATDVVGIRAKEASVDLNVVAVGEPGSGTLTELEIVDIADEVQLALGIGVVNGAVGEVALPTTASLVSDFRGVTRLNEAGIDEQDRLAEDGFGAGGLLGVQENEAIWVSVTDAVTADNSPHWQITGDDAGKFSGVLVGTAQVSTLTATAEDDVVYRFEASLSNGKSFSIAIDSGSSATATTIADDLRAAMVLDAELSKHVVGTGTATLILTSLSGVTFDVFTEVIVPATGVDATTGVLPVVFTTPGVVQSHLLEDKKFLTSTTAAGLAKLQLG